MPISTMHWSRLSPSASGLWVSWASSRTWTLKPLFRLTISATAPRVTTRSPSSVSRRSRSSALTVASPGLLGIIPLSNPYIGQCGLELYVRARWLLKGAGQPAKILNLEGNDRRTVDTESWRLLLSTISLALRPQAGSVIARFESVPCARFGFPASHFRIRRRRWGPWRRYRRCNVGNQRFFDRIGDFVGVREQLTDLP